MAANAIEYEGRLANEGKALLMERKFLRKKSISASENLFSVDCTNIEHKNKWVDTVIC